ncbi:MAG: hypothetical protein IH784_10110 [Bacteroidetes bacterium]|nr:hypothetical protein [Bacteroidota bacterium]
MALFFSIIVVTFNDPVSPPDDDPIELNANIKVGNVLIVNLLNMDKNLNKNGKKKPFDL